MTDALRLCVADADVTAVGGTDFAQAGVIGDEKAWTDGGGGFSNTFGVPSYQVRLHALL